MIIEVDGHETSMHDQRTRGRPKREFLTSMWKILESIFNKRADWYDNNRARIVIEERSRVSGVHREQIGRLVRSVLSPRTFTDQWPTSTLRDRLEAASSKTLKQGRNDKQGRA